MQNVLFFKKSTGKSKEKKGKIKNVLWGLGHRNELGGNRAGGGSNEKLPGVDRGGGQFLIPKPPKGRRKSLGKASEAPTREGSGTKKKRGSRIVAGDFTQHFGQGKKSTEEKGERGWVVHRSPESPWETREEREKNQERG